MDREELNEDGDGDENEDRDELDQEGVDILIAVVLVCNNEADILL